VGRYQSHPKIIRSNSHQIQSDIIISKPSPTPPFTLIDIWPTFPFPVIGPLYLPQNLVKRHLATHLDLTTGTARPSLLQQHLRKYPHRSSFAVTSIRHVDSPRLDPITNVNTIIAR